MCKRVWTCLDKGSRGRNICRNSPNIYSIFVHLIVCKFYLNRKTKGELELLHKRYKQKKGSIERIIKMKGIVEGFREDLTFKLGPEIWEGFQQVENERRKKFILKEQRYGEITRTVHLETRDEYSIYGNLACVQRGWRKEGAKTSESAPPCVCVLHCKNSRGNIHTDKTGLEALLEIECTNYINYIQQTLLWPDCNKPWMSL